MCYHDSDYYFLFVENPSTKTDDVSKSKLIKTLRPQQIFVRIYISRFETEVCILPMKTMQSFEGPP
jgi:hypothetical protein